MEGVKWNPWEMTRCDYSWSRFIFWNRGQAKKTLLYAAWFFCGQAVEQQNHLSHRWPFWVFLYTILGLPKPRPFMGGHRGISKQAAISRVLSVIPSVLCFLYREWKLQNTILPKVSHQPLESLFCKLGLICEKKENKTGWKTFGHILWQNNGVWLNSQSILP